MSVKIECYTLAHTKGTCGCAEATRKANAEAEVYKLRAHVETSTVRALKAQRDALREAMREIADASCICANPVEYLKSIAAAALKGAQMSSAEWKKANAEKMRQYRRAYNERNIEKVRAHAREFRRTHKEKRPPKNVRGVPDPVKRTARNIARGAYRRGKIVKPAACEVCARERRLHMHHDDYAKPLVVRFLCVDCHAFHHRKAIKEAE